MRRARRSGLAAALVAVTLGATGCFASGSDFRDDAETYIVESDDLRAELFPESDTTIDEATCAEPESKDVGETFACTAVDSNGGEWGFEIEITGSRDYLVVVSSYPPGG